jgi:hypothetical protein
MGDRDKDKEIRRENTRRQEIRRKTKQQREKD